MFNVGNYIKDSAKSIGQRIIDDVVSQSTTSLPQSAKLLAANAAQSLQNIGASVDSIETFASNIVDDAFETSVNEFFALAGGDVGSSRAKSTDLNTNAFLANVNPTTKIASKSNSIEVIVVV